MSWPDFERLCQFRSWFRLESQQHRSTHEAIMFAGTPVPPPHPNPDKKQLVHVEIVRLPPCARYYELQSVPHLFNNHYSHEGKIK